MSSNDDNHRNFKRVLRPIDVWGLALGAIIGWGCFVLPGDLFLPMAGPLGTAVGMLIGAAIVIVISFSYSYLLKAKPLSGGEYIYTEMMLGKRHAFVCGWSMILMYWALIPLNGMALALITRYLFPGIVQVGYLYTVEGWDVYLGEVALATGFMVLMAVINMFSVKSAARVQTFIALLLAAGILVLTAVAFVKTPTTDNLLPLSPSGRPLWKGIFSIVAVAPWAFLGFDCIPQSAEEFCFSHRRTLWIMVSAIIIAALLYIFTNTLTALYQPWETLVSEKPVWATGFAVKHMIGTWGLAVLGISMFCAAVSGMNAFYMSVSRLIMSMSEKAHLPRRYSVVDSKHGTPRRAILFVMLISLLAPWFGRVVLIWIVDLTSMGAAIVFVYTCVSAAILAWRSRQKGQAAVSMLGAALAMVFLVMLVVKNISGELAWQSMVMLAVWVAMGFSMYFATRARRKRMECGEAADQETER